MTKNKTLFAANVLGTVFFSIFAFAIAVMLVIIPCGIWWEMWGNMSKQIAFVGFIVEAIVFVFMGIMMIGVILGWMGYKMKNPRITLASFVLYAVCTLVLLVVLVGFLMLPVPVLAFIGYRKQKRLTAGANVINRM